MDRTRVTSLRHVSVIYMIEPSDDQQWNIFWAAEYFNNKDQQTLIQETFIIIIRYYSREAPDRMIIEKSLSDFDLSFSWHKIQITVPWSHIASNQRT